jgi:UrcA family protein
MAISNKLLGAAVSVLSLACTAVYADSAPVIAPPSSLVRFNDLNLDQLRDVARLYSRISSAADRLCGTRSFAALYNKNAEYQSCYSDAVAHAVAQIDRPSVTDYFQQLSSNSPSQKLTIAQK